MKKKQVRIKLRRPNTRGCLFVWLILLVIALVILVLNFYVYG